jgi:hypothetical protein
MGTWTATPRTWVAGEVPTAANFNTDVRDFGRAFADAWTSYTPTLTASTTNPTNWTQTGFYMRAGKLIICKFKLTAGASMTAGSGTYRIALPVSANTTIADIDAGLVIGYDNSTGNFAQFSGYVANTAYISLGYGATYLGAFTTAGNAAPWTWAANDFIRGQVIYEAA